MNEEIDEEKIAEQRQVRREVAAMQTELAPEYGAEKINSETCFMIKAADLLI